MALSTKEIELLLPVLGFQKPPKSDWSVTRGGYEVKILRQATDSTKMWVDFGPKIKIGHKGIQNLSNPENLVVVDAVLSLLERGYKPEHLELEPKWKLGHGLKGRLDILVHRPRGPAYAMVECKSWGAEYAKERNNLLEDGGQLFSYYVQDRNAQGLYLYSAKFATDVARQVEFFETKKLKGRNKDELFASWDQQLFVDGLFRAGSAPYAAEYRPLLRGDLKQLDHESGRGLFNSFAEVLRRNVLSDKTNAFNKIFNLFVCKLQDEDSGDDPSDELRFQWKPNDTPKEFLERLTDLYRAGIANYLGIQVDKTIHNPLLEFSFIDVFDEQTLERNTAVLREVVQLLQSYQIRYSEKHQFLGDFFEMLLNTGLKQEAGQFFTPVPLARFVLRSLPLDTIIAKRAEAQEAHVLPYIVDYACGAGHFLTEAIDEVDELIDDALKLKMLKSAKDELVGDRSGYRWAREYIYGVEGDYRLAKVTKVAMFLNGDGDAEIINGDGLDDFTTSTSYRGRLKAAGGSAHLEAFDVVVSNPPYSIANFRRDVKRGTDRFKLFPLVSASGGEIETLFVERTAQMLRPGGVAGVFLPLSVLNSDYSIYRAMRRLLLIEFRVVGLVELRERTFMATGTTTICAFLRRRDSGVVAAELSGIAVAVADIKAGVEGATDVAAASLDLPPADVKEIAGLDLWDAAPFTNVPPEVYSNDLIVQALVRRLDGSRNVVVAFSGETGQRQESFLGYRFSRKRGSEGIQYLDSSALFDASDRTDPTKLSTQIRNAFEDRDEEIPAALDRSATHVPMVELFERGSLRFKNPSSFFIAKQVLRSHSPFGDFIDHVDADEKTIASLIASGDVKHVNGATYPKSAELPTPTSIRILTASNLDLASRRLVFGKFRYLAVGTKVPSAARPKKGDLVICIASGSLNHLGKVVYVDDDVDAYTGGFLALLRAKDQRLAKVIHYNLLSLRFREYVAGLKDQNINNLTQTELARFTIRIPRDLAAFSATVDSKERELRDIDARMAALNSA